MTERAGWVSPKYAAREYYKNFTSKEGRTPIDARVILGAVIIKHFYVLSDIDTIEMIKENPYLQYFIGYKGFTDEPAFDPSLFVTIRKRMSEELFDRMTGSLMKRALTAESKRSDKLKAAYFGTEKEKTEKREADVACEGGSPSCDSEVPESSCEKTPLRHFDSLLFADGIKRVTPAHSAVFYY